MLSESARTNTRAVTNGHKPTRGSPLSLNVELTPAVVSSNPERQRQGNRASPAAVAEPALKALD